MPVYSLLVVDAADQPVAERLWLMFRHDLSEFRHLLPNPDGTFRDDRLQAAFGDPDWLAYLVMCDDRPAGLALIRGITGQVRVLSGFFVVRGARRSGVGRWVVRELVERHPGRWEVAFQDDNHVAVEFWRRVATEIAGDAWTTFHARGWRELAFVELTFDNGRVRVLAVWCPDWPVVAAGAGSGDLAAVVAGGQVVACTAAARAAGVRRGLKVRDAQGRCANLVVHADDLDAQVRLFEQVVSAVEAVCPRVEVIRPGLLAAPARGPSRYYGGEQQAADSVRAAAEAAGFDCAVGVADGSFAAALAARRSPAGVVVPAGRTDEFLAPMPVSVLDRSELAGLLVRLGIRTLGDFAALPARDVVSRFGGDGGTAHRLARGLDARPLVTRPPGEDLSVNEQFDPPYDAEPVVFAAKTLADRLHDNLARHGLACVRVEVEATFSGGQCYTRLWRHDGLLSSAAIAERVRWQLDSWRTQPAAQDGRRTANSRADGPPGGVVRLRLAPDQIVTAGGTQLALWGADTVDDAVDRAATRVQAMLGHTAVTRPVRGGGHGPGERVVKVPWGDRLEATTADPPWPGRVPEPSPAVVHPDPLPVAVVDADGRPVTVSGRCVVSAPPAELTVDGMVLPVIGWTGPWPAIVRWWDADAARRLARFQVVTDDGRGWLLLVEGGRWLVEASYL